MPNWSDDEGNCVGCPTGCVRCQPIAKRTRKAPIDGPIMTAEKWVERVHEEKERAERAESRVAQLEEALRLLREECQDEGRCSQVGHRVSLPCVKLVDQALGIVPPFGVGQ